MSTDASKPSSVASSGLRLPNFAAALRMKDKPVKIVALGSSTTAGEGRILAYPYRLEVLLRATYTPQNQPNPMINVLNRGVGGEEAPKEFDRMPQDVVAEQPSLVIWQVGTNSVWQPSDQNPPSREATIDAVRQGIALLRQKCKADIILMDPQYVPAMLTADKIKATHAMVEAIAAVAKQTTVNLFGRFELMRQLHEAASFGLIVDPTDNDHLHDS